MPRIAYKQCKRTPLTYIEYDASHSYSYSYE